MGRGREVMLDRSWEVMLGRCIREVTCQQRHLREVFSTGGGEALWLGDFVRIKQS